MGNSYLEKLMNMIPQYKGYGDINYRELSDKSFREAVAEMIQKIIDNLRRTVVFSRQEITEDKIMMVQRLLFRMDRLVIILIKKEPEYRDFFKVEKIKGEDLERLTEYDYKIVTLAKEIHRKFLEFTSRGLMDPESRIRLQMLIEGMHVLEKRIKDRISYLTELYGKKA